MSRLPAPPFGVLSNRLDALTALESAAGAGDLLTAVAEYARTQAVSESLRELCGVPAILAACAARSIPHPLGFDKFVLTATDRYQIQLHIWWPGTSYEREHVHDHRFGFVSAVLAGRLRMSEFVVAATGETMNRFEERHEAGNDDFLFRFVDAVPVRCKGSVELGPGGAYFVAADLLHRVDVAPGGLVATLFVKLRPERLTTTILVDPGAGPPPPAIRRPYTTDEADRRLRSVAVELERAGAHR